MSVSWKRTGMALAIAAGGIGLFFLSTFSFLAVRGKLDTQTLVRLPLVGGIFDTKEAHTERLQSSAIAARMRRIEQSLDQLESRLRSAAGTLTEQVEVDRAEDGSLHVEITPIVVNLQGSEGKRFLKSAFTLGIETDDEDEAQEAFASLATLESRAAIRDAMLRICREKTIRDLEDDFELDGLKKEIAQAVQNAAFSRGPGRVKDVFVKEFVIQ